MSHRFYLLSVFMNKPIFSDLSVVMLCFNDEAYIAQAIEAILRQDLTPGEFIIVDDHSTDTSWKIIQSYAKRNACISAYRNDRNLGAAKNLNYSLGLAKKRWLYGAASDDLCMPGTFSKVYKAAKENPDVGVITGAKFIEDPQQGTSCTISVRNWKTGLYSPKQVLNEYFKVEHPEHSLSPSVFLREDLYRKYGGYQESLGGWVDTYLMRAAAWDSSLYYIDAPLTTFRVNPTGYSRAVNSNPQVMFDVLATAMRNFCSPDVSPCWPVDFIYSWWLGYRRAVLSRYVARLQNEHIKLSDELLKVKELKGGYSTASIDVNSIESAQQLINFWNEHYVGNILKSTAADCAFLKQLSAAKSYWEARTHINSNGFVKYVGNDDTLKNDLNETGVFHPFLNPSSEINNVDRYWVRQSILESIKVSIPLFKGRFLDVGCGIMPYKDLLMQSPSKIETYIGLDIETEIYQADVDLRWDGRKIPLEDASIDSAMATEVLEHCPDPLVVLREIRRVLKPGGAFFFTVPYIWPLHDAPWDFYRYTPFSLKNLLKEAGFEDLNIRALSGWDASLAQMMGLWMKRAPMSPERRNAMAQKLWPIYQELIESDELPSDPEAGNTMATGWSGLVYAAAESDTRPSPPSSEIAAIDLPVVIVRSHAHNYSETFIEDHVQYISNQATVLYGWPFPRFIEGDRSVLDAAVEQQLVQALRSGKAIGKELQAAYWDGLAQFFKARGVRVALLESGLMGAMVSEACVRAELPHVVHFHGVDAFAYKLLEQWQAHYQRFFRTSAAVVGVSQEMLQQLSTLGAADESLVLAPCGVSTELETYAQPLEAQPVFLSVGRLVAKKAPHKTLQAFEAVYQKVPAARLIMVGEGPMLKKCKAWVQQQGIQGAVTFAGVQSRRSVSRLMACARVFVQHSMVAEDGDHEGLPVAILEAGAHGLPVVATRHAGIPDAVREEIDGFLVDEGDVQAMALAMYRLAQDSALAARMGAAYQQRVRSDYSRAVSIARLQKLLQATAEAGYRKPTVVQAAPGQQAVSIMAPKPIANLEEMKSAIVKENDAGTCLQLAQRASELGDETVAYECYEKAVSLDRSCGPAYLEMGKRLGQAAQYADAYLCLKEAERAGQLDATSQQLLQALAANPDLQTDSVLQYQQRRQVFDGQLASQPRRILIFTNLLPPQEMGGYGRSIWELCEGLLLRGHTVSILTADVPELQQKAYAGYERVERHVQRDLQLFGGWSQGGAQAIDDVEQIKQIARHNVKLVLQKVSTFQPDVCMVGNLDFLGAGMLDPILKHGVPVLHRLGNGMPGYSADMTPQSPLYCVAGCSEWVNGELQANGFNAHNFALLPPGSPLHEYCRFVPPNYDQLRICFAGLMMAYKGPHLILEALDYLKKLKIPFSCEFAGDFKDPAFEQQFKLQMRQYQLEDSIRLLGFCDREQLRAMYDRSNVLVMPSVFEEPFGKVQIEAQAAGLAVVRSPVGGYKDMIEDGVNGLLFKSEDAKDLARQLFVLRGDAGLWSRIALQGQHDAFRFKTQASVETLEALFEELIAKRMAPELQGI